MLSILVVLSTLFVLVIIVSMIESSKKKVEVNDIELKNAESKECGCGKTNNIDGKCDGSHMNDV
jgi:CDGSH-type Zn-finger protein